MNQFKRWITAEPSKNHSFIRSIPLKLLTGTLLLYIGYMFIAGTGAVFASAGSLEGNIPFTQIQHEPRGYAHINNKLNI
jgi:hypothetical protein